MAASGGLSLPVIGKMLGHTQASTTQRYAYLASDPVKAAMAAVAEKIAGAMKGRGAKVMPLRQAGGPSQESHTPTSHTSPA